MDSNTTGFLIFALGAGVVYYRWKRQNSKIEKHISDAGGLGGTAKVLAATMVKSQNNYAKWMNTHGDSLPINSIPHGNTSVSF